MIRSLVPWRERFPRQLTRLEEEMENLRERFFGSETGWLLSEEGFSPHLNVVESDGQFEVTIDVPGMKPEDIHVEFRDGVLTVHGKREEEKEEEGKTYHRVERRYGEFRRVIPLATSVEEEQVEARYTNGVLHITVPKTEKAQPKPIEVKT